MVTIYQEKCRLQREEKTFEAGLCIQRFTDDAYDPRMWHPQEQQHFDSLRYEARRKSYYAGRYAAKEAIRTLVAGSDLPHRDIWIDQGVFQFPVVICPRFPNIQVSITHSENEAAAVAYFEHHPLGIDIETMPSVETAQSRREAMESQMTASELEKWSGVELSSTRKLYLLWTAKEALSKVLRTGMMTPFSLFEVDSVTPSSGYWISHFTHFSQYKALSFWIDDTTVCSLTLPRKSTLHFP